MIYILSGNDNKKKNAYVKTLTKKNNFITVPSREISKELIDNYTSNTSLFGELSIIVFENFISLGNVVLSNEDLEKIKNSPNIFILLEDKLLTLNQKKYKKYAEIINFDEKKVVKQSQFNIFSIANAFGAHNKIKTWMLYREAIEAGIEPEPISGILFWKIKNMILSNPKSLDDNLKKQSGELVSLYHRAHRGECDFVVGLEQFILSSLIK